MNALERIQRISKCTPSKGWTVEQFQDAAKEAKRRWIETQEIFGIKYHWKSDAVSSIDPKYSLPTSEERDAVAAGREAGTLLHQFAVSFVRWSYCPATKGYPNPYEPWIEIWEHGGQLSAEHGIFLEIHCPNLERCGVSMIRA